MWSAGSVIDLGGLPGFTFSEAFGINDAGQVVGFSQVGVAQYATEWSGSTIINLGGDVDSEALGINNAGQVVGYSAARLGTYATEWRGGSAINLGGLPGDHVESGAYGINDTGQIVGYSIIVIPEPSTWAMMLLGFAGLTFAGHRRARAGGPALAG